VSLELEGETTDKQSSLIQNRKITFKKKAENTNQLIPDGDEVIGENTGEPALSLAAEVADAHKIGTSSDAIFAEHILPDRGGQAVLKNAHIQKKKKKKKNKGKKNKGKKKEETLELMQQTLSSASALPRRQPR
jgi:hypothetical protein